MSRVRTQRGARAKGDHRRYEMTDLDPRTAAWTVAAIGGIVIIVCLGVAGLFLSFGRMREPTPPPPIISAAPALQIDERADRASIDAGALARLDGRHGAGAIGPAMRRTAKVGWDSPR